MEEYFQAKLPLFEPDLVTLFGATTTPPGATPSPAISPPVLREPRRRDRTPARQPRLAGHPVGPPRPHPIRKARFPGKTK